MDAEEEEEDWLPVALEEPLSSDCCGSGCTPCVQDIYQEELARWRRLKEMSVEERRIFFEQEQRRVKDRRGEVPSAISPGQYTYFDVESVRKAAGSANMYRFKLPPGHTLGLSLGQHIVARWVGSGEGTLVYTESILTRIMLSRVAVCRNVDSYVPPPSLVCKVCLASYV